MTDKKLSARQLRILDRWIEKHVTKRSPGKLYRSLNIGPLHYSTNHASAMLVLEACVKKSHIENGGHSISDVIGLSFGGGVYTVGFQSICGHAKHMPLPICLFAKKLFGGLS